MQLLKIGRVIQEKDLFICEIQYMYIINTGNSRVSKTSVRSQLLVLYKILQELHVK